jgi:hypothetical protein
MDCLKDPVSEYPGNVARDGKERAWLQFVVDVDLACRCRVPVDRRCAIESVLSDYIACPVGRPSDIFCIDDAMVHITALLQEPQGKPYEPTLADTLPGRDRALSVDPRSRFPLK